jgi:hypothetical protein
MNWQFAYILAAAARSLALPMREEAKRQKQKALKRDKVKLFLLSLALVRSFRSEGRVDGSDIL